MGAVGWKMEGDGAGRGAGEGLEQGFFLRMEWLGGEASRGGGGGAGWAGSVSRGRKAGFRAVDGNGISSVAYLKLKGKRKAMQNFIGSWAAIQRQGSILAWIVILSVYGADLSLSALIS